MAAVSDHVFSGDDGMDINICHLMSQLDCLSNSESHDDRNVHTLIHKCTPYCVCLPLQGLEYEPGQWC